MKERIQGILIGIIITIILIGRFSFASQRSELVERFYNNIRIILNGTTIVPKDVNGNIVEPFIIDGTTYLPVRAVSEALGLNVSWSGESNTVVLTGKQESNTNKTSETTDTGNKDETPSTSVTTQYGKENSNANQSTKQSDADNGKDTLTSNVGAKTTDTSTDMKKKALEDAQSRITNYNYYGISKKSLTSYLSNKYINSEVKYAMENIDVDWNEQALKCAKFCSNTCNTRSTMKMYVRAYGFTDDEIDYAINHMGDFWKRSAVKYANMYNPDFEHMKIEGSEIITYKKTFEEYMKEYDFTDEEIEFARNELKYKQ